jgi:hypothetical protein
MDTGFAWGWMRIHCHWVHRYAANAVWAKLPHVVLGIGCTVVAGALPLRPAGVPLAAAPVPVAAVPDSMLGYVPVQGINYFGGGLPGGWFGGGFGGGTGGGRYRAGPVGGAPTEVPEPGSVAVLLAGVAALVLVRRWRR